MLIEKRRRGKTGRFPRGGESWTKYEIFCVFVMTALGAAYQLIIRRSECSSSSSCAMRGRGDAPFSDCACIFSRQSAPTCLVDTASLFRVLQSFVNNNHTHTSVVGTVRSTVCVCSYQRFGVHWFIYDTAVCVARFSARFAEPIEFRVFLAQCLPEEVSPPSSACRSRSIPVRLSSISCPAGTENIWNCVPKKRVEINRFSVVSRLAGTTGAVVTCPLEVVKTRLQSSSSFGASRCDYVPRIASEDSGGNRMTCKTISSVQRRRYNTLSGAGGRHSSTQILTFSQCGVGSQTTKSMGLVQCLR